MVTGRRATISSGPASVSRRHVTGAGARPPAQENRSLIVKPHGTEGSFRGVAGEYSGSVRGAQLRAQIPRLARRGTPFARPGAKQGASVIALIALVLILAPAVAVDADSMASKEGAPGLLALPVRVA